MCNWTIKTTLNCVSITMLLSVSCSVRCSVMEYIFVFDSTLCTMWVMPCLDESGTTLYLWSAILYQSQDYIVWKCTYQTTRETIVVGDSYVQGNNSCVVVWPKGYKGNIGLTDMEIESKWLQSEDKRSYNPITVIPSDQESSSKEHFWSIVLRQICECR